MRHRLVPYAAIALISLALGLTGCSTEIDPDKPEGGYLTFRDALFAGDLDTVWDCLSADSKALYEDALADLQAIRETAQQLSPGDRQMVAERTAVRLLETGETAKDLFKALARLDVLNEEDGYAVGSGVDTVTLDEDGERATIVTEAGQEILLVKEEDARWRVDSLQDVIDESLAPITDDVMAVEVLVTENAYMRRSPEEVQRLLGVADPVVESP